MVKARAQARVAVNKAIHRLRVTRHNNHHLAAVVFHELEQGVDDLIAKVVAVLTLRQCVSLINKQHTPQRRLQYLKRFDS